MTDEGTSPTARFRGSNGQFSTFEAEIKRIDQLREADQRAVLAALAAQKEATAAALTASDKAINKAEEAQLRVNATQNEFRGSLADQNALTMPRLEAEGIFRELRGLNAERQKEIAELRSRLDIGPLGLQALQRSSDESKGRATGQLDTRTLLISLLAAAATVISIFQFLNP